MVKKKSKSSIGKILNRRASHDYVLGDVITVGLVLTGAETKSLRMGHGHLQGAYVTVKDHALWLVNATISGTSGVPIPEDDQSRSRKLLAKQREIDRLLASKEQGNTIVPLEIITGGKFIKLKIAVGRGKKQYDKRASLKKRETDRKIQSTIKNQLKE